MTKITMMKRAFLFLTPVFALLLLSLTPPTPETTKVAEKAEINWMTWNEVEKAIKENPKKVFVDVYTCWCGPCKMFSNTTLKDPKIVDYINKNYYAIKFDAQYPGEININGTAYKNPKFKDLGRCTRNGTHELAYAVATTPNGRLAFPTTVYFDENFNKLTAVPGMLKAPQLEIILTYFASDDYKNIDWPTYEKNYQSGKVSN